MRIAYFGMLSMLSINHVTATFRSYRRATSENEDRLAFAQLSGLLDPAAAL
jgi:hypothetical protein